MQTLGFKEFRSLMVRAKEEGFLINDRHFDIGALSIKMRKEDGSEFEISFGDLIMPNGDGYFSYCKKELIKVAHAGYPTFTVRKIIKFKI